MQRQGASDPMEKYTFSDYIKALTGAGHKTRVAILGRAIYDPNIDVVQMAQLISYAYGGDTSCPD